MAGQEELSQARGQIEELQEANATFKTENEAREAEVASLAREGEERSKELSSLRNRLNLSQQNWSKEREDLIAQGTYAREEFESAKQAMQDWEVLAMEERSIRENLGEKVAELEEQLASQRQERQGLETERNGQAVALEGLQRALQEIQDGNVLSTHCNAQGLTVMQRGRSSYERWWRTLRRRSRSFGRRSRKSKKLPRVRRPLSRPPRKSWSVRSHLRWKPKRRTCSLESYDTKRSF